MDKERKKSFLQDPQNIIALGVTLISVCALIVSIKQTQIMSEERNMSFEQAKASVWPRLDIGPNYSMSDEDDSIEKFSLILNNGGIGPAIITQVRVYYEDEIVNDWWELFSYFNLPDTLNISIANADFHNSIIKIGEERTVLDLNENLPIAQAFFDHQSKITIEIFYESIYKERWKLIFNNWTTKTEALEELPQLTEGELFRN